jgi:hypothetical protein
VNTTGLDAAPPAHDDGGAGCKILADGTRAIAAALLTNSVLTALELRGADMRDAGATAIADALAVNTRLERLSLIGAR